MLAFFCAGNDDLVGSLPELRDERKKPHSICYAAFDRWLERELERSGCGLQDAAIPDFEQHGHAALLNPPALRKLNPLIFVVANGVVTQPGSLAQSFVNCAYLNLATNTGGIAGIDFKIAQQMLCRAAAIQMRCNHVAHLVHALAGVGATIDRGAVRPKTCCNKSQRRISHAVA